MGLYDYILSDVDSCSVITCHASIDTYLEERFSIHTRSVYLIPSEFKYAYLMQKEIHSIHYPDVYENLCENIEVAYPGELFLVGAGFLGKIYCSIIKSKGELHSILDVSLIIGHPMKPETYLLYQKI